MDINPYGVSIPDTVDPNGFEFYNEATGDQVSSIVIGGDTRVIGKFQGNEVDAVALNELRGYITVYKTDRSQGTQQYFHGNVTNDTGIAWDKVPESVTFNAYLTATTNSPDFDVTVEGLIDWAKLSAKFPNVEEFCVSVRIDRLQTSPEVTKKEFSINFRGDDLLTSSFTLVDSAWDNTSVIADIFTANLASLSFQKNAAPLGDVNAFIADAPNFLAGDVIEVTTSDTTFADSGLIFKYEKEEAAPNQSTFLVNFPANAIDQDFLIPFDTPVSFDAESLSATVVDVRYGLRLADSSTADYTDFPFATRAALNAATTLIPDGTKYYVHVFAELNDTVGASITYTVSYVVPDNQERIAVLDSNVDTVYRPFGNAVAYDGVNDYLEINDAALNTYLSWDQANPFTFVFWFQYAPDMNPVRRGALFHCENSGGNNGWAIRAENDTIRIFLFSTTTPSWSIDASDQINTLNSARACMVVTYDGARTSGSIGVYFNGLKQTVNSSGTLPPNTEVTIPNNGLYNQSRITGRPAAETQIQKCAHMRIYDDVLNDDEIRRVYNDINYVPNLSGATLIRDYDYNSLSGATVPELVTATNATLINSANTRTNFYL